MTMDSAWIMGLSAELAADIEDLAEQAYARLLQLLQQGMEPRAAVKQVLLGLGDAGAAAGLADGYATRLAEAFSAVMAARVAPGDVLHMKVGDVALSKRLYQHARQTGHAVAAIVRQHAQGLHDARALALRLYDGYDPRDGIRRPLEGAARAELPQALRELTRDASARAGLDTLYRQMQQQAERLKSPALRAGYMELLDAWGKGKGQEVLRERLAVAMREKTRYMANRIAQTELARAHADKVARGFMQDDSITVVQVKLNPRHPVTDICDLHASADLYGLGKGCYPKNKAPKPIFHPHCWCVLVSRPDLDAQDAKERKDGVRQYLRGLDPADAARVLGSRERLAQVMNGADWEAVTQAGVPNEYRLKRLGDAVQAAL